MGGSVADRDRTPLCDVHDDPDPSVLLDSEVAERTLLLLSTDHGEIDTASDKRVHLDTFDLESYLQLDGSGNPIPPLGGPRNLQFHARDDHQDTLRAKLEDGLAQLDPLVLGRDRIIEEGLFGDRMSGERFEQRCPDLLAIPKHGFAGVEDTLSKIGMHGGMTPDEMLVPFVAVRIDELQGSTYW